MMMRHLGVISLIIVATLMLNCQPAIGDDLADLKAANESIEKALNAGDAKALFENVQDEAVLIMGAGFPGVMNMAEALPMMTQRFENYAARSNWYKVDYRVMGNTGLVWGVVTGSWTNKATNVTETDYSKVCRVFVKSEGKWKMVMIHNSPIILE
jgi:ketosteroid isomerase-like protein